jgi:hypothetical protein
MRRAFAVLGVAAVVALVAGGASAGSGNHAALGTPGTSNCVGQSTASLAQTGGILGLPGISGMAALSGLTVEQLQGAVSAFCTSGYVGSSVSAAAAKGSGGETPSCEGAKMEASALNAIADSELQAAQAWESAGFGAEGGVHRANAQALRAAGEAIVSSSCGPQ